MAIPDGAPHAIGSRVRTLCPLASADKSEHPAGMTGCVYQLLVDGVMVVSLDNARGSVMLVHAEAGDVEAAAVLPRNTTVVCHPLLLQRHGRRAILEQGTRGLVVEYNEDERKYKVWFESAGEDGRGVCVHVPAHLVNACRPGVPQGGRASSLETVDVEEGQDTLPPLVPQPPPAGALAVTVASPPVSPRSNLRRVSGETSPRKAVAFAAETLGRKEQPRVAVRPPQIQVLPLPPGCAAMHPSPDRPPRRPTFFPTLTPRRPPMSQLPSPPRGSKRPHLNGCCGVYPPSPPASTVSCPRRPPRQPDMDIRTGELVTCA